LHFLALYLLKQRKVLRRNHLLKHFIRRKKKGEEEEEEDVSIYWMTDTEGEDGDTCNGLPY
jgi:hypothetical protein